MVCIRLDAIPAGIIGSENINSAQIKSLLAADFSSRNEADLGELLKHDDMRVRMKVQFELAKRGSAGASQFQKAVSQNSNQLARVHAIWGYGQLARQDAKYAQSLLPLLQDSDAEIRAQAAKWLGDIRYKKAGNYLIPLLKDILAINPNIKIFGSPWSPPKWMKDNNSSIGGRLLPQYYSTFANYLVKYIQGMKK